MTVAEVKALFADPEKLLRRCYLHIAGGATRSPKYPDLPLPPANGQAVVATFQIEVSDFQSANGFTTGLSGLFGKVKERPFVKITKQPGAAKANPAADEFNAYYVPMVQTSDIAGGMSHYTLPTNGQPTIMITSKLSGCRFGVGSDGNGAVLVSHVQPSTAVAEDNRQQDLVTQQNTGFTGAPRAFATGQTYDDMAAVIGVRTGQRWRFYQQASHLDQQGDYVLDSVKKI
jgi:hypothetical protein